MNLKGEFRTLSLIHTALLIGQLMMLCVMLVLTGSYEINADLSSDTFLIIAPALSIAAYYLGSKFFQMRIDAIEDGMTEQDKFLSYRSAVIIRLAMIEGAALVTIMAYFLTGNFLYVIVAAMLLFYFYTVRPSEANFYSVISGISQ